MHVKPLSDVIVIPLYRQVTAAGAAANCYGFISDGYYEVVEVRKRHSVNGGAAAAVDVQKTPAGTALGAGTSVLGSTFDLTANANSATGGQKLRSGSGATALATARTSCQLAPGDSLGVVLTGTLTALVGLALDVVLKRIRPNRER